MYRFEHSAICEDVSTHRGIQVRAFRINISSEASEDDVSGCPGLVDSHYSVVLCVLVVLSYQHHLQ